MAYRRGTLPFGSPDRLAQSQTHDLAGPLEGVRSMTHQSLGARGPGRLSRWLIALAVAVALLATFRPLGGSPAVAQDAAKTEPAAAAAPSNAPSGESAPPAATKSLLRWAIEASGPIGFFPADASRSTSRRW